MRGLWIASLCVALICASHLSAAPTTTSNGTPAQTNSTDESAIRGVVDDFAKSWNAPGMPGFEDLFTPDADFVVITGVWFQGRDKIVTYHRALLAGHYKGSHLSPENVSVRLLSPQVAVAHVDWKSSYLDQGKELEQTALMTLTLAKQDDGWKIAAAHNTLTSGPRFCFHKPPTPQAGAAAPH